MGAARRPRSRRAALGALAALLVPARPAAADPPGGRGGGQGRGDGNQGKGNAGGGNPGRGNGGGGGNQGRGRGGPPGQAVRFGASEPAIIRDWRFANPGWAPRPLPPGQMRQLARGKPLPPGIARQAVPPGLLGLLPVRPGYSYALVGTSLVLLGAGGVVVDILAGLF